MATVYHHQALVMGQQLAQITPLSAATLKAAVDTTFPNWSKDAGPTGYVDADAEAMITFARAAHAGLPAPLNGMPFDWSKRHGFTVPEIYLSVPSLSAGDLSAWIGRAVDALNAVVGD